MCKLRGASWTSGIIRPPSAPGVDGLSPRLGYFIFLLSAMMCVFVCVRSDYCEPTAGCGRRRGTASGGPRREQQKRRREGPERRLERGMKLRRRKPVGLKIKTRSIKLSTPSTVMKNVVRTFARQPWIQNTKYRTPNTMNKNNFYLIPTTCLYK